MNKDNNLGILLESGTNELEIVEFTVGSEYYGINVAKVKEIIRVPKDIVPVPHSHPSLSGMINIRGKVIPVINLAQHLNMSTNSTDRRNRIVVSEFNNTSVGFLVETVTKIHRISWTQVEKPSGMIKASSGNAVGVIKLEKKILLLLDFEMITIELSPDNALNSKGEIATPIEPGLNRSTKKILIAEDSSFIGNILAEKITAAGYQFVMVTDGLQAWELLEKLGEQPAPPEISAYYNLLITDIEMPKMDGLHLIKRIKENNWMNALPCIVFSSMISPDVTAKSKSVGADATLSKPELNEMIRIVDKLVL